MSTKKTILCFGDSLTWGWIPVEGGAPSRRYPYKQRWTGVMAAHLRDGYHVIEEGLSGRTTCLDDPNDPRLNGSAYLPAALASHLPLDLAIVMLGTNDTKSFYRRAPIDIANGLAKLIGQIRASGGGSTPYPAPAVLVIAPPPIGKTVDPWHQAVFSGALEKSTELAGLYRSLAAFHRTEFLDAGEVIGTDGADGIHFTRENNADLGLAVAEKVKQIL